MGYEKEHEANNQAMVCVVESTDDQGRIAGRDAFSSREEGEVHAAAMKAKGFTVSVKPIDADALERNGDAGHKGSSPMA